MNYNIVTVSNEDYSSFLKLFVESLFKNTNLDKLNTLYIFDTGLGETTIQYLKSFDKINVVNTDLNTSHKKLHDEDWERNTYSKMNFLYNVLYKTGTPTFLIDVDSVFKESFTPNLNNFADIIACRRKGNHISEYIGSFFGAVNIEKSLLFIKIWSQNLQLVTQYKHKESPALSLTIQNFKEHFKIQDIEEDLVSCTKESDKAKIYHLKSDGFAITIDERLDLPYAKETILKLKNV